MKSPKKSKRQEQCIDRINHDIDSVFVHISEDYKDVSLELIHNEMVLAVNEWYMIVKEERKNDRA